MVIKVRQQTKGAAGFALVAWSIAMAASLFGMRANLSVSFFEMLAVISTVMLAAYLGWKRRMGVIFAAPMLSWMFAWPLLIIGEMIRDGFFKGLVLGAFWATAGWIVIGITEFGALMIIGAPFRLLSGATHHDDVTIEWPWS
jgi:hypothetical protein